MWVRKWALDGEDGWEIVRGRTEERCARRHARGGFGDKK